jgi:uncharacterized protein (TIGR02466 family)
MKKKVETLEAANIHGIFSTPIYRCNFSRPFTHAEMDFIRKQHGECRLNIGNRSTKDNYILNKKIFRSIKKELERRLQDYLEKVICPKPGIRPYITQSWINYTGKGQYHHEHQHDNSYISGVLYLTANKNVDRIYFQRKRSTIFSPPIETFNDWNSSSWWMPIHTATLIMFPSWLVHNVGRKEDDDLRVSLSFNSFIKGTLGTAVSLTELKL